TRFLPRGRSRRVGAGFGDGVSSTSDDQRRRVMVEQWPLIGRDDLVRQLATWIADPERRGVALVGEAGTGKTTIARAVCDAVAGRGHVVELNAWPGAAAVPYAALSNVLVELPAVESDGPLAVTRAVATYLEEHRGGLPCVVWVDDAHDVDDASAAVLS